MLRCQSPKLGRILAAEATQGKSAITHDLPTCFAIRNCNGELTLGAAGYAMIVRWGSRWFRTDSNDAEGLPESVKLKEDCHDCLATDTSSA
jgi:hypothetical protein